MTSARTTNLANLVPWLVWLSGQEWRCERCGQTGIIPTGSSVGLAIIFLKRVVGEHRKCREPAREAAP
jgi:hypothetical protein